MFPSPIVRERNRLPVGRVVIGPLRSAGIALLEPPAEQELPVLPRTGRRGQDGEEKSRHQDQAAKVAHTMRFREYPKPPTGSFFLWGNFPGN